MRSKSFAYCLTLSLLAAITAACSSEVSAEDVGSTQAALTKSGVVTGLAGHCLDVPGGSSAAGTIVQMGACNASVGQTWEYTDQGDIRGIGGMCLDVQWGSTAPGTPVHLWPCHGGPAQKWDVRLDGSIVGLGGLCMDVRWGDPAVGTPIHMWPCNGGAAQKWVFAAAKCGAAYCGLNEECGMRIVPHTIPPQITRACVCREDATLVDGKCVSRACGFDNTICAVDARCVAPPPTDPLTGRPNFIGPRCRCNPGFAGDGKTCDDVDECARNVELCGHLRSCTNTAGSYTCTGACRPPAVGVAGTCMCPVNLGDDGAKCRACGDNEIWGDGLCKPAPAHFVSLGLNPDNSNLGEIDSNKMQGIAHSTTHWFWTNERTISRARRATGWTDRDAEAGIPSAFANILKEDPLYGRFFNGYDHWGDPDFYNGKLYVPLTDVAGILPALVLAFDHDLHYLGWGRLAQNQKGGAWVAVNPIDGLLYSSITDGQRHRLNIFDPTTIVTAAPTLANIGFKTDPASLEAAKTTALRFVGTSLLEFTSGPPLGNEWWDKVWTQGGAFSKHGVLYYTVDHMDDDDSDFTGVHAFKVIPAAGPGIYPTTPIRNPKEIAITDGSHSFLHIPYNAEDCYIVGCSRHEELEGITVTDEGEFGVVHQILLDQDPASADEVNMYNFRVDNAY